MDKERLSNESYRTGLWMKGKQTHTQLRTFTLLHSKRETVAQKNNSPDVRSACKTCCWLIDREKDAASSMDLVLDGEEL